jgi:glycosyltransferase involved in cell wall biosynthesis
MAPRSPEFSDTEETIELSIVMPCLDEAETVAACIDKARDFFRRSGISGEIIVGDNGSTDGSQRIAADRGALVVDVPVRGYGAALRGAIRAARGKYIIMGDADASYDFAELDAFVEKLRGGYGLVMGNRFQGGIAPGAMPWKNRWIGNPALSFVGRILFGSNVGDFHCGLRGLRRDAFELMDLKTDGMEFASEMVIKAALLRLDTCEVPTTLSPDGRSRRPHLRPWRDGWRHLRFMLLFSPNWLFLYPGILLVLGGASGLLALLPGPIRVGPYNFDVHTMLYFAMMLVIGVQFLMFAAFTKVFVMLQNLVPASVQRTRRLFRYAKLEVGLTIGLLLLLFGGYQTLRAFWSWQQVGFGDLVPAQTLRVVVPALIAILLGFQVIFSSLFFSILGLSVHLRDAGPLTDPRP